MRVVVVGDVGVLDGMIHIGDEAMFEELVTQLRERGATEIVGISANPGDTATRYGIVAIPQIGFPESRDRVASSARRGRVLRAAAGDDNALSAADPAHAVIAAIRSADGVAISGGGNMASTWPMHIDERSTIGAIAAVMGVPLVVSGQTIGPGLTDGDAELVRELLSSARRVGLRESASLELCARLGVPAHLLHGTVDDASFLGIDDPLPAAGGAFDEPYCLVSLSGHVGEAPREEAVDALAALLDTVHRVTDLPIAFLPHFGSLAGEAERGDDRIHAEVRARMTTGPGRSIVVTDSRAAAALARSASLVVTSRYHPAVFAAAGGVPILGIHVDDYTRVKLTGALANLGQLGTVALPQLITSHRGGDASMWDFVEDLWTSRESSAPVRSIRIEIARRESDEWWDAIAADFAEDDGGR